MLYATHWAFPSATASGEVNGLVELCQMMTVLFTYMTRYALQANLYMYKDNDPCFKQPARHQIWEWH